MSLRMDRTEGQRIERDPTMDNHIVHAVSVSNKKEQSQLRNKERNLQNEFKVEQHIIRREEKSLLKQFHKLQLEKYHRHHDEIHSPRGSERRLLSAYGGVARSGHSIHHGRMGSPASSGHVLHKYDKARHEPGHHEASHPMTSQSSMRLSRRYPSSSMISSNYAPSYVSSIHSTHRSTEGGLPHIDSHVSSRHGAHDHRHRRDVMTDSDHQQQPYPSQQQHPTHPRDEIESLVDSYMLPHQPAGYGHSIKDERKDTHWHRLHRDKHKHRRHTVDFDYPGNYRTIGILHRLNDIGPDSYSHSRIDKPKQDTVSRRTSDSRMVPRNVSIEHEKQLLRAGATDKVSVEKGVVDKDGVRKDAVEAGVTENGTVVKGGVGKDIVEEFSAEADGQRYTGVSSHGKHTTTPSHATAQPQGKQTSVSTADKGQNLQITIQINRKKGGKAESDDVMKVPKSRSTEDKKPREGQSSHRVTKSRSSLTGSNKSIGRDAPKGRVHQPGTSVRNVDQSKVASVHPSSQDEVEAEMLAELKAMCSNATQGYFAGKAGGFGNRRARFKQLVKELLMKQMPAMARKRHLAEFDPLEALQCRYLRLSPTNIQDLVQMCRESGVDVDIHPHSQITDISRVVFPHDTEEDAQNG